MSKVTIVTGASRGIGAATARACAEAGHKVAICDQVEDPRKAKGIVRREVTRVVTPGLVLDPESLDESSNNYLFAITPPGQSIGVAWIDVSTGESELY